MDQGFRLVYHPCAVVDCFCACATYAPSAPHGDRAFQHGGVALFQELRLMVKGLVGGFRTLFLPLGRVAFRCARRILRGRCGATGGTPVCPEVSGATCSQGHWDGHCVTDISGVF